METMYVPIKDTMQFVPVLSSAHLVAYQQIISGQIPDCPVQILNDLKKIGWLKGGAIKWLLS